jgi:hypothetical protein
MFFALLLNSFVVDEKKEKEKTINKQKFWKLIFETNKKSWWLYFYHLFRRHSFVVVLIVQVVVKVYNSFFKVSMETMDNRDVVKENMSRLFI